MPTPTTGTQVRPTLFSTIDAAASEIATRSIPAMSDQQEKVTTSSNLIHTFEMIRQQGNGLSHESVFKQLRTSNIISARLWCQRAAKVDSE
ncbi:hypothetical protein EB232_31515 [Mesorhizobium sp. NZP2077]|nr:hypothetical protein EB232_31515 [Mesorhizobium sp. NZP2077]